MALLTEPGINRAHVCGASLGSMVVQNTDTHHSISGSGLLLIEGTGHDLPTGARRDIVMAISGLTAKAPG